MTALRLQKLEIEDCEPAILHGYFDWGRGNADDSDEPAWDDADEATRLAVARRGYDLYDGYPAQPGNSLGPTEIFLSVGINSRVILNDACRFLSRAEQVRPLLARIPDDARLEDANDDHLDAAAELLRLLEDAEHIGRGKVTKVLHKKRPAFIPIIDSVVGDFLWKNFPWRLSENSPARDILILFRDILLARREALAAIQANLTAQGLRLTTVRVLDKVIWLGWHQRDGEVGFGTPMTTLWNASSLPAARQAAEEAWCQEPQRIGGA